MELEIAVERDLFNGVSFSACFHDYFQVVDIVQYFYDCGLQYKVVPEDLCLNESLKYGGLK